MTQASVDMRLVANICKQCGKPQVAPDPSDPTKLVQAPMLHYGMDSYHADCMPFEIEQLHRPQHSAHIDAAKSGLRGDELRKVAHTAAAQFEADEQAWLAAEAAEFERTGVANDNPTHVMHAQDGE